MKTRSRFPVTTALLGLVVSGMGIAVEARAQNLVTNGGFEIPPIASSNEVITAGSTALTGWTITGSSGIDLVRDLWQTAEGAQSISLNWATPSTIEQSIVTQPGAFYVLDFAMAAEHPADVSLPRSLDVMWGSTLVGHVVFDPAGHTNAAMGWEFHQFIVQGTGTDLLTFKSTTADAYGPALDAVSVMLVPAPSSVVLLSLGGVAICRRRR